MNGIYVEPDHLWVNRRANILPQKHKIETYEFKENYVDRLAENDDDDRWQNNDNNNNNNKNNDDDDGDRRRNNNNNDDESDPWLNDGGGEAGGGNDFDPRGWGGDDVRGAAKRGVYEGGRLNAAETRRGESGFAPQNQQGRSRRKPLPVIESHEELIEPKRNLVIEH